MTSLATVQRHVGVTPDGVWGPRTGAAIMAALGAKPEPERLTVAGLQSRLGVIPDGKFGPASKAALLARLSNLKASALVASDFDRVAAELRVPVAMIRAVRKVEAPRGAFDIDGRPSILYERHVFRRSTEPEGRFDATHPALSGPSYGPGGYGAFSAQYDKLAAACALDPEAAFMASSWGAFQVLGENAVELGYPSAFDMAMALTVSEAAHLDSFVRFVRANGLEDELRACRPGDADSCIAFVSRYNGPGFRQFAYHVKLAEASA